MCTSRTSSCLLIKCLRCGPGRCTTNKCPITLCKNTAILPAGCLPALLNHSSSVGARAAQWVMARVRTRLSARDFLGASPQRCGFPRLRVRLSYALKSSSREYNMYLRTTRHTDATKMVSTAVARHLESNFEVFRKNISRECQITESSRSKLQD